MISIKTEKQLNAMRKAGRILADLHDLMAEWVRPGVTTLQLDREAEAYIRKRGGKPAFKGYHNFPATLCTSVNDEVVHGIPGNRVLNEGDIVGVDMGAIVEGFYADAARTFPVGNVDEEKSRLIHAAKEALARGIAEVKPGNRISDISHAVQKSIEHHGFGIVREYVGHGIGANLHEEPQIPNFGKPHQGAEIKVGMAFAIEPMVNGGGDEVFLKPDGWTVATKDGRPSSHFENTVLVTDQGAEVITENV
jgi:methionyl aminopeptidase